jgi:hypothetical protein
MWIDPVQKKERIIWMAGKLTGMSFQFSLSENNNREILTIIKQVIGDAVEVEVHIEKLVQVHLSSSNSSRDSAVEEATPHREVEGIGDREGHDHQHIVVVLVVVTAEILEIIIDHHGLIIVLIIIAIVGVDLDPALLFKEETDLVALPEVVLLIIDVVHHLVGEVLLEVVALRHATILIIREGGHLPLLLEDVVLVLQAVVDLFRLGLILLILRDLGQGRIQRPLIEVGALKVGVEVQLKAQLGAGVDLKVKISNIIY